MLYQENDWVYVISEDSREGFIPHSYTAQFGSQVSSREGFIPLSYTAQFGSQVSSIVL